MSRSIDQRRLRELFEHACSLPAEQLAPYLDAECLGDSGLRAELESLLSFDRVAGDVFSESRIGALENLAAALPTDGEPDAPVPERIGRYRVIRRIGTGGMGEVFEARQDAPDRRVALKLMRPGMDTASLIRRFRQEGQVQSRLSHPGIAAVYEAGVHAGVNRPIPFLAMEFVDGTPIIAYCRAENLSLRQRIELMIRVCDAVGHAHRRGVIHRDLKPDNILVEPSDAGLSPKVLDFGVAKITGREVLDATRHTEAGQIVGTLCYMSPEQLGADPDAVDTQTDIYALGLVLYELLGGSPAFDTTGQPVPEALRRVTQSSPRRLGTVAPALRGDIETIVHKALEREKHRRYTSATELAADLQRFLRCEPISARPPSAVYQLSRFVRRNRALTAATILGVAALATGVIGTALQARAAVHARDDARLQQQKAEHETEVANAVADMLRQVFAIAGPDQAKGRDPTLREAIAQIDDLIGDKFKGPPEAEAIVRNVAGIIDRNFGDFEAAQRQFDRSLEIRRRVFPPDSLEIADSLQNISTLKGMTGHPEESIPLMTEALLIQRLALGEDDPIVARSTFNLARAHLRLKQYDRALDLTNESLSLHQRILPNQLDVLGMHYEQLAAVQRATGDLASAAANNVKAVDLVRQGAGPESPTLAVALLGLARTRLQAGDLAGADEPSREAVEIVDKVFAAKPDHPTAAAVHATRSEVVRALERSVQPPAGAPASERPGG